MRATIGEYVREVQERSPRPLSTTDLTALGILYELDTSPEVSLVLVAGLTDHDLLLLARIRLDASKEAAP